VRPRRYFIEDAAMFCRDQVESGAMTPELLALPNYLSHHTRKKPASQSGRVMSQRESDTNLMGIPTMRAQSKADHLV
jgi:hypothetical protein